MSDSTAQIHYLTHPDIKSLFADSVHAQGFTLLSALDTVALINGVSRDEVLRRALTAYVDQAGWGELL